MPVKACGELDFERDGTCTALWRLLSWALNLPEAKFPMRDRIACIPSWLHEPDLELACCKLVTHDAREDAVQLIRELRVARVQMDNLAEGRPPLVPSPEFLPTSSVDPLTSPSSAHLNDPRVMAATARLAYGEFLEAIARARALALCCPIEIPAPSNKGHRKELARLFYDSYHASVWTSAHAEYLVHLGDLIASMQTEATSYDVQPPIPSPLLVPFAIFSLPDLSVLINHKASGSSKASGAKHVSAMAQILWRCTHAGSRGWDSILSEAVKDGEGCARICRFVLLSALTGLHPCIHPANRPVWETRTKIFHIVMEMGDSRGFVSASPAASKEATRLYLAAILSNMPATREALLAASHPAGALVMSPIELPAPSMIAAMNALSDAGVALLRAPDASSILSTISSALAEEQRRSKRPVATKRNGGSMIALSYTQAWLGRSQPPVQRILTLIDEVNAFCFSAFKADFVPLWHASWTAGTRLSRLDAAQHSTLARRSSVQKLIDGLPDARRLYIQRLALRTTNSELLSIAAVSDLLGHPSPPVMSRGQSTLAAISDGALAAELVYFAKISAMGSNLKSWDLGERTRMLQLRALRKRLMLFDLPEDASTGEIMSRLPTPATNILVCIECKRIANACCELYSKDVGFNELGVSSSMFRVDGDLCGGHMRCAKRSSAALRTAIQLEEESRLAMTGANEDAPKSTAIVPYDSSAAVTKLRRDQKSVFEQVGAAVSCGDQPLVRIPVLGNVVKVFGNFYSLCALCGALCQVQASNRYAGEICCLHCDADMLSRDREEELATFRAENSTVEKKRRCRFCGKPDTSPLATTKWRTVPAPLDSTGENKSVPGPLRVVTYCPSHYKAWLVAAHRELSTEVIFSHLSSKAKPIAGAERGKRGLDEDLALPRHEASGKPKKQRRVKMLKRRSSAP